MVNLIRKKLAEKDGLATIETALILMLLVVLTFGAMEYGWVFFKMQQVSNVAREGARIAALADSGTGNVQARVDALMTDWHMGGLGYTTTIYPSGIGGLSAGSPITVTVQVPYNDMKLVGIPLIPIPANITSSATMAKEGS